MPRLPISLLALLLLLLGGWLAPGMASAAHGGCPGHAPDPLVVPVDTAAGVAATPCDHGGCNGTCGHWVCPLAHASAAAADTGTRTEALSPAAPVVAVMTVALPDLPWVARTVLPPPLSHSQDPTQKRRVLRL